MSDFQEQLQYFKPSIPSSEITRDINMMNQLVQPNASIMGNFSITDLTVDDFLSFQQLECQSGMAQNLPGTSHSNSLNELPIVYAITSTRDVFHESKKRKVMELSTSSSESISLAASGDDLKDSNSSTKKNVCVIFLFWLSFLSNTTLNLFFLQKSWVYNLFLMFAELRKRKEKEQWEGTWQTRGSCSC